MITGEMWGALGVEAASGVRAVLREALDDGGLTSIGTVTTTLPSAALRGDAEAVRQPIAASPMRVASTTRSSPALVHVAAHRSIARMRRPPPRRSG